MEASPCLDVQACLDDDCVEYEVSLLLSVFIQKMGYWSADDHNQPLA
jgi:hypothetical protein